MVTKPWTNASLSKRWWFPNCHCSCKDLSHETSCICCFVCLDRVAVRLRVALEKAASPSSSGSSSSQDSNGDLKLCNLVTQSEAQDAYGGDLTAGVERNDIVPTCIFSTKSTKNISDNVQLQQQSTTVFDGVKQAENLPSGNGYSIEPVSGIGDDALFQINNTSTSSSRSVLLGFKNTKKNVAVYVSVTNANFSIDQTKDAEKKLAKQAADKLSAS